MNATESDRFDLARFVDAQAPVYQRVVQELSDGRKGSHWMWFVFPQIEGLGSSPMSMRFAIRSLAEARAYLDHPVLGVRLRECTGLVLRVAGRSALEILGSPDDAKFRSCLTLFGRAGPEDLLFPAALQKYFGGRPDEATLARLA